MRPLVFLAIFAIACVKRDAKDDLKARVDITLATAPRIIKGKTSPSLPQFVTDTAGKSRTEGRKTVVYVGATWCEPCQRFHKALENGELNAQLSNVDFIEFDADSAKAELQASGYWGMYIPLFVKPGPDGRGQKERVEGAEKGEGAVAYLTPRLKELVAK